ncbi:MAG: GtrA family protein [Candidatus Yanofskybacteria bacterium]|nr:GtrA family protein [Candidatus Yanofskybacteria bacterium]
MKKFTSRDLLSSLITGLTTGIIAWRILEYLDVYQFGFSSAWLVLITPLLWIVGVNLGYYLGRHIDFFTRFGRFAAIGFTNAAVDFGALYGFIAIFGEARGLTFSLYKAVAFGIAVIHSYFWNKYWTFDAGQSPTSSKQFVSFVAVALVSLLVNVGIATLVYESAVATGSDPKIWAGISAVAGSAAALVFSYLGFKILVFKK